MAQKKAPKEFDRKNGPIHPSMKGSGSKSLHPSAGGGSSNVGQVRVRQDPAFAALKRRRA